MQNHTLSSSFSAVYSYVSCIITTSTLGPRLLTREASAPVTKTGLLGPRCGGFTQLLETLRLRLTQSACSVKSSHLGFESANLETPLWTSPLDFAAALRRCRSSPLPLFAAGRLRRSSPLPPRLAAALRRRSSPVFAAARDARCRPLTHVAARGHRHRRQPAAGHRPPTPPLDIVRQTRRWTSSANPPLDIVRQPCRWTSSANPAAGHRPPTLPLDIVRQPRRWTSSANLAAGCRPLPCAGLSR
ncbi:Hypothetical protein FKW44_020466, partial [Caligus rogercresseyi]